MGVDVKEADDTDTNFASIEANIQRAKKKKKVDFRAEMTSDSQDIDDLLLFQSKEKNETEKVTQIDEELLDVGDDDLLNVETDKGKSDKKSLEELLNETDSMFKEVEDKTAAMDADLNVDETFNFDDYINQQGAGD